MAKNLVKKYYSNEATFVTPAGVTNVKVRLIKSAPKLSNGGWGGTATAADGTTFGWGGLAGDGTSTTKSSAVSVETGLKFFQVATNDDNSIASPLPRWSVGVLPGGEVRSWGSGSFGARGGNTDTFGPVTVFTGVKGKAVAAGTRTSYVLDMDGKIWACGLGTSGQLGDGTIVSKSTPVAVAGATKFIDVKAAGNMALALDADYNAWAWGENTEGSLGNGAATGNASSPVAVIGGQKFRQIAVNSSNGYALDFEGNLWAWGYGGNGSMGNGSIVSRSSPVMISAGLKFTSVTAGGLMAFGITSAGDVYGWGFNALGQLGDGTIISKSTPTLVIGGKKFIQVAAAGQAAVALSTDGKLYGWGFPGADGVWSMKSSPVAFVGGSAWKNTTLEVAGEYDIPVVPGASYQITFTNEYPSFGNQGFGPVMGYSFFEVAYST